METFVDIHCHLLPALDDGAKSIEESLAMARMAVADGIETIVATPHQLGNSRLEGHLIRRQTANLRQHLRAAEIPLQVLLGADVRVEPDLMKKVQEGTVLTLADRHKHVLLELPHEVFLPIDQLLKELHAHRLVGILSHPERNEGLMSNHRPLLKIVDQGGLLQITAGSLLGAFGSSVREFAESLVLDGLVHFVATDAHDTKYRPPLMRLAYEQICQLTDKSTAERLCTHNPANVINGCDIPDGQHRTSRTGWRHWLKTTLR
jgi:protein-tyrosine phosphatase